MEKVKLLFSAALAGMMIGIGGTVYLLCSSRVVGTFLFTIGLLAICELGLALFTGRSGFLLTERQSDKLDLVVIWGGNFIGCLLYGGILRVSKPAVFQKALELYGSKTAQAMPSVFFLAVMCGILMYIAVAIYRKNGDHIGKYLGILFCVPVFIFCGFEHSIADMFYFVAAQGVNVFNGTSITFLLIVTLGNALGSVLLPLYAKLDVRQSEKDFKS